MRRSDRHEYRQAYNAQAVVCADGTQLVLATNLVATTADAPSFAATILAMEQTIGLPKVVLADTGYASGPAVAAHMAAGQMREKIKAIAAKQKPPNSCTALPANADPKSGLAPFLAQGGVNCPTITQAEWRGASPADKINVFEASCSGTGYMIVAPAASINVADTMWQRGTRALLASRRRR